MTPLRFVRFNIAGALGVGVQMGTLWLCLHAASLHYLAATGVAVAAALLHNFVWHWRWTWRDRAIPAAAVPAALARFVLANGTVSLASNLVLVSLFVEAAGLPALPASLVAIAAGGVLNFYLGDRAVFRQARHGQPGAGSRRIIAVSREPATRRSVHAPHDRAARRAGCGGACRPERPGPHPGHLLRGHGGRPVDALPQSEWRNAPRRYRQSRPA